MSLGKPSITLPNGVIVVADEVAAVYKVVSTKLAKYEEWEDAPSAVVGPHLKQLDGFLLVVVLKSGHEIRVISENREELHTARGDILGRVFDAKNIKP